MSTTLRGTLAALIAGATIAAGIAAAAASPALASTAHLRRVSSKTFQAAVSFPASWTKTPHLGAGRFGYDGASGFIQLNAATEPGGLRHTCRTVASGGTVRIFGQHPHITFRAIDGRPGCVITPSRDAPRTPARRGGPKFQTAEALVAYRHAITIQGARYPLLAIFADPGHIRAIAGSVKLRH